MKDEVWINGERLDLYSDTVIAITKQINDIFKFDSFQCDYTNKFIVPSTSRNNRILGHANSIFTGSNIPYTNLSARLLKDGVELIHSGRALIEYGSRRNYNITIVAGNADFFDSFGEKILGSIDLSTYDHTWDRATIIASAANTSGYIWPIINYIREEYPIVGTFGWRQPSDLPGDVYDCINTKTMFPAMFVKTILELVVTNNGWNIGDYSPVFGEDFWDSLIIPYCGRPRGAKETQVHTGTFGFGNTVAMTDMAPDMTIKEFLKSLAHILGWVFIADEKSKTLNIYSLDEILNNFNNAYDWSSKVDESESEVINRRLSPLAQNNYIKYKVPEGYRKYYNPLMSEDDLTTGIYITEHEGLEESKIQNELFFAASETIGGFIIVNVADIPEVITVDTTPTINWGSAASPRILCLRRDIYPAYKTRYHEGSYLASYTDITADAPYCFFHNIHYDDLAFDTQSRSSGASILARYHKFLTKVLAKPVIISQKFRLSPSDIYGFNHLYPVYIKKFHSYFYVNKIDNYTGRGSTEVELVKI